jgi:rhodanese-related sulfurtransferase
MQARTTSELPHVLWLRGIRQAGLILLVALIPAVLAAWFHPRRPAWSRDQAAVPQIEWTAVQQLRSKVLLIDARSAAAFERGHIPAALWLGTSPGDDGMVAVARAWQPGTKLVVYCDGARCDAAQSAARRLRLELGLNDVVVLKGGWSAWSEAHSQGR